MSDRLVAVILAAGRGTRMRSATNKVLHPLLGRTMASYPVEAALGAGARRVTVVVGHQGDAVMSALNAHFPDTDLRYATQHEQRGTGHAVQCAIDSVQGFDTVLILCGDTPTIDAETLSSLREAHDTSGAVLTVVTFTAEDPTGYGRVVCDDGGRPQRIVEHRDATEAERAIDEVNAGMYLVAQDALLSALEQLDDDNAQGEVYLTDIVALVASDPRGTCAFRLDDPTMASGINDRVQLAALETVLQRRRNEALMRSGVTIQSPATVRIESGVTVGQDSVIGPGVTLAGHTVIGAGCRIDTGCVLTDCELADQVHLKPYVVATDARIDTRATAGPFAQLRSGTVLGPDTKVGNFVETKKAVFGAGAKASHLSYLGDCELGRDVNVGAGTITCNYDGFEKHRTVLEDGVFVGSDTQLVAPVHVGKNATIAAGSTVTQDVPEGALVHSRIPQALKRDYYERRRTPREEDRARKKAEARGAN